MLLRFKNVLERQPFPCAARPKADFEAGPVVAQTVESYDLCQPGFYSSPSFLVKLLERHPRNIGISVVLPATCELMARHTALRLFPEYKHIFPHIQVFLAQYAEIDWDSGRTIIVTHRRRPQIPACIAAEVKPERKRLPRLDDEESVQ
jgi:hypothetical protein